MRTNLPMLFAMGFLACLSAMLMVGPTSASEPDTRASGPIPVSEVRSRGIAGELGVPLGQVVTLHATVVDGKHFEFKGADAMRFIRVDLLDGKRLQLPVLLELATSEKVKDGETLNLTGHETGGYEGIVFAEFGKTPPAGVAYGFVTRFVGERVR